MTGSTRDRLVQIYADWLKSFTRSVLNCMSPWDGSEHLSFLQLVFGCSMASTKAAAQILLGVKRIPVRIFVDPDEDMLLTANTNAGTTLRQVAFDKSVQRRLGSSILRDRIGKFKAEKGYPEDFEGFSETDLVEHFRGEQRAMSRYVLDSVRDAITHSPENKLRDFIEYGGKGYEKPFSYISIERTFYSQFISPAMLQTPWNYQAETGENPRELEAAQIIRLMNIIADKIYVGQYQDELGTRRIEHKIQNGEDVPEPHLRAFRMAKEEVLHCWRRSASQIVHHHFIYCGKPFDRDRAFQHVLPAQLWTNITNFIQNLAALPLWVNREASSTVFGTKNNHQFWQTIFATGRSPNGHKLLPSGLDLTEMIKA